MIYGTHLIVFSSEPDADRAFLADILGFEHVDAGGGWLIFGLPPQKQRSSRRRARDGVVLHVRRPRRGMRALEEKGVACSAVEEARWGSVTKIRLPGGGEIGLYAPRHAAMVEPR